MNRPDSPSPLRLIQTIFDSMNLHSRLLTNANCTHILDLSDGYPLRKRGTWEWIGNWTPRGLSNTSQDVEDNYVWMYSNSWKSLISDDNIRYPSQNTITTRTRTWSNSNNTTKKKQTTKGQRRPQCPSSDTDEGLGIVNESWCPIRVYHNKQSRCSE